MSRWTDEELRELTTLWPTHSVSQIVKRLHRPRAAIRSKAKRLRLDGLPPHDPSEDVDAGNLPKRRPLKAGPFGRGRRSQPEGRAKLDSVGLVGTALQRRRAAADRSSLEQGKVTDGQPVSPPAFLEQGDRAR